jgi:hypothetical protein
MVKILFIENEGMAWVLKFLAGKLFLTPLDLSLWVELGIGCGIQSKEKTVQII